jgi:hypothetical protein
MAVEALVLEIAIPRVLHGRGIPQRREGMKLATGRAVEEPITKVFYKQNQELIPTRVHEARTVSLSYTEESLASQ